MAGLVPAIHNHRLAVRVWLARTGPALTMKAGWARRNGPDRQGPRYSPPNTPSAVFLICLRTKPGDRAFSTSIQRISGGTYQCSLSL